MVGSSSQANYLLRNYERVQIAVSRLFSAPLLHHTGSITEAASQNAASRGQHYGGSITKVASQKQHRGGSLNMQASPGSSITNSSITKGSTTQAASYQQPHAREQQAEDRTKLLQNNNQAAGGMHNRLLARSRRQADGQRKERAAVGIGMKGKVREGRGHGSQQEIMAWKWSGRKSFTCKRSG
jgi:hypothetical protein